MSNKRTDARVNQHYGKHNDHVSPEFKKAGQALAKKYRQLLGCAMTQ